MPRAIAKFKCAKKIQLVRENKGLKNSIGLGIGNRNVRRVTRFTKILVFLDV